MSEEDDRWALRLLKESENEDYIGIGSYRYSDGSVVHRAVWMRNKGWHALCGAKVVQKLREHDDPGIITCVACLGHGA